MSKQLDRSAERKRRPWKTDRDVQVRLPMKEGRESGIGGERSIFFPKREGYKYKHNSYEKDTHAKRAARNKRMYAKYGN